ncbi:MAG: TrkA C-terminal domain-containing protein, partial [Muribaculaceae bacterium]|nr:TrkA C-terminal domain-containing protein [Muribaculaceae bacterium]
EEQIQRITPLMEAGENESAYSSPAEEVRFDHVQLSGKSPLIGQTVASADLRNSFRALIVAIQRGREYIAPEADTEFHAGDVLWLVAQPSTIDALH